MSRVLPGGCICRHEPSSPAPGKEAAPGWLWVRVLLAYQTQGQGTQGHQKMGQQPIQPPHAFTEALKPSPSSLNRDSCSPMSPTTRTDGGFLPNCCDQFFFFFFPLNFFYIPTILSLYLFLLSFLPLGPEQAIEPGLKMPQKNSSLDMAKVLVSSETKQKAKMK